VHEQTYLKSFEPHFLRSHIEGFDFINLESFTHYQR